VALKCGSPVLSVAFSHDGKTLACGTQNSQVLLWTTATHQQKGPPLHICGGEVYSVAFSPVRDTFATGCSDDTVKLWNLDTGQQIGKNM
jgi:WD40 repeat protein